MYPIDCHTGLAISLLMLVDMITGLRLTWDFLSVFFLLFGSVIRKMVSQCTSRIRANRDTL